MWYGPADLGSTFSTTLTRDPPYCFIINECFIHTPTFCVSRQNWPFLHTNSIPEDPRSVSVNPAPTSEDPTALEEEVSWDVPPAHVRCPHCPLVLYKRNLFLHIQRKHGKVKDTTAQCHLQSTSVDQSNSLYTVRKTSRGLSVPCVAQDMGTATCDELWDGGLFFYFGIFGDGTQKNVCHKRVQVKLLMLPAWWCHVVFNCIPEIKWN